VVSSPSAGRAAADDPELAPALEQPPPVPPPVPVSASASDDPAAPTPAPRRRVRRKASPAVPPSPTADASALADESRLLTRVRGALGDNDFDAALEWAEAHRRRHPHGSLTEERLILVAVAACRGGQRDRGLAAVEQLREQFPKAAALAKVERACADESTK
jgi:hypothetical protein